MINVINRAPNSIQADHNYGHESMAYLIKDVNE
jgi:hypothetical protein